MAQTQSATCASLAIVRQRHVGEDRLRSAQMLSILPKFNRRGSRKSVVDMQSASNSSKPLISLHSVTANYGSTIAIRDVDLEVRRGEIVAILGANGAGKTTTLKTIVGLVDVAGGTIAYNGEDITGLAPERIVERGIALTPEGREVFGSLTCRENLRVGAGLSGQGAYEERLERALQLFPVLRDKLEVFAGLLSGGEQQQLAIARSLMSEPDVLLLDEPSLGLAPIIVERVFELITQLRDRGTTLIIAEQNVDKALQIANRAIVLSTGRIELEGASESLRRGSEVERAFLGLGVSDA